MTQANGPVASDAQALDNFGGQASGAMSEGGAGMFKRNASSAQFDTDSLGGTAYGSGDGTLQPSMMMGAGV